MGTGKKIKILYNENIVDGNIKKNYEALKKLKKILGEEIMEMGAGFIGLFMFIGLASLIFLAVFKFVSY